MLTLPSTEVIRKWNLREQHTSNRRAGLTVTTIHPMRRVFSFPVMLACVLSALAVLTVRQRFDDPDMWWHLKMGEIIWTTHTIPRTDLFSFTTGHHGYIPHEWLSQIVIYGAYKAGGYVGLMALLCVLASVLLVAGYCLCWLYSGNAKIAFVGGMVIWMFSTIGLGIRPHMFGYIFLIVELILLHLGRTRNPRFFWGLPVLFAIWVNTHGSFFLGLLVAGVVLASSFFRFQAGLLVSPSWDPRVQRTLAYAFVLSIAALFLNPVGVKQVLYPIDTLVHQPLGLGAVQEWQPVGFENPLAFGLLAVIAGSLLLVIVRWKELFWQELLMLAMGTWLAASHERMLFAFGILAAPILTRLLRNEWESYDVHRDHPIPNAVLIAASFTAIYFAFPSKAMLTSQVATQSPVKAVEFLKSKHISGPMLNEYVYGGYLIWAAPEYPVFIDGRADVFEATGVFSDFGKWATLQQSPNELLDKYKINFCLLTRDSHMVRVLPLAGWTMVYSDDNSAVFVRNVPKA
jgi:hypothetical protein